MISKQINIKVPTDIYNQLKALADKDNRSISNMLLLLILRELRK